MKRKDLFSAGISFLVVTILAVTAFIRGPKQIWFYAAAFILWGLYMITALLLSRKERIKARFQRYRLRKQQAKENKRAANYKTKVSRAPEADEVSVGTVLLRHVNHRISAYLKSAYPEVTWEWVSDHPEQLVAKGGTGRIQLYGIPDFNYADVVFDQLARIDCDMMRIVPLAELDKTAGTPIKVRTDQPMDPEIWYNIQGKNVLESCIAELHSRGYASLTLKENGEIHIRQADEDIVHDKFRNFPAKNYWQGLVKVLEHENLAASVTDDGIKVSW